MDCWKPRGEDADVNIMFCSVTTSSSYTRLKVFGKEVKVGGVFIDCLLVLMSTDERQTKTQRGNEFWIHETTHPSQPVRTG